MTLPFLLEFSDLGLLLLRIMIALVFGYSGVMHLKHLKARAESLGMPQGLTAFIGVAEVAGALGILFGVLPQLAAIGLIIIMGGAIHKKIFVWKTGFWGDKNSGWHYDMLMIAMNAIVITTGGGLYTLAWVLGL